MNQRIVYEKRFFIIIYKPYKPYSVNDSLNVSVIWSRKNKLLTETHFMSCFATLLLLHSTNKSMNKEDESFTHYTCNSFVQQEKDNFSI